MYHNLVAPSFLAVLSATIKQQPHAQALVSVDEVWSYEQLDQTANRLQFYLADAGLALGAVVAIHTHSRALAIAAMIAILREGGAYLPLDPLYPAERLQYMVENASCSLIICDNDDISPDGVSRVDVRALDMTLPLPKLALAPIKADSDAYIIYTSGSTGKPKGVRMNHGTLNNLIQWQNQHYIEGENYRTLQFSALSFDVSFQEIFSTLCQGGCLVLVPPEIKQDFRALLTFVEQQGVERLFLPYIALLQLIQWANRLEFYPEGVREWITAGEQLVISDEVRKAFIGMPHARLINQYGPSESHVVTELVLPDDPTQWPAVPSIGYPIETAQLWVLDEHGLEMGLLEEGELWIGGPVLGNGYINNAEETAKRFVVREIDGQTQRIYRTGDLASKNRYGEIAYKGRIDAQVKISGYRVELAEIEAQLLNTGAVREIAVAVEEQGEIKRLVAFMVDGAMPWNDEQHFAHLARALPFYMVPSLIVRRSALLKTPSGKVDRKSLLAEYQAAVQESLQAAEPASELNLNNALAADTEQSDAKLPNQAAEPPQGAQLAEPKSGRAPVSEAQILAILRRELLLPTLTLDDNLVAMGMTSLGANRVAAAFYDDLGLDLPTYTLFQHRSVARLVAQLTGTRPANAPAPGAKLEAQTQAPVAIVGVALRVPGAQDVLHFWRNLVNGQESVHFFEPTSNGRVNARGVLAEPLSFDEQFFDIPPIEAKFIDPQQRLLLELAWQALENAGVVPEQFNGRIGVYCGTGNNSYYLERVLQNPEALENYGAFAAMLANEKDYCATRIAYKLNLVGPAVSVHSACSTSLVAVCQAVEALRLGHCDIAIAGGASLTFPQQQPHEHQEGSIYSADGHTRPFDAASSGTVFSDGGAMVVLKRLDYALADGDHIYASIKGIGINNDGADKGSFSAPSLEGQRRVIGQALLDAGVSAGAIGLVEAHGTATPVGDPIEVAALTQAYREHTDAVGYCHLGSLKSNFGHLTASAGVAGLIKTALCVEQGARVASINFATANPALNLEDSPFVVTQAFTPWPIAAPERLAGVSSFGIGGTNAHAVLQGVEYSLPDYEGPEFIPFCLSAKNPDALARLAATYSRYLEQNPDKNTHALAAYLLKHRTHFTHRLSLGASSATALSQTLHETSFEDTSFKAQHWILAFPGQGSQVLGMGRQLMHKVPAFAQAIEQCLRLLQDEGIDLASVLWGDDKQALNQTHYTQLALFVIGYALTQTLIDLGLPIKSAIGHSIGELVAATCAGVFELPVALKVVTTRGRVMQAQPTGAMLAVRRPSSEVSPYLVEGAVIAATNTSDSCTLAGTFDAIDVAEAALKAAGMKTKRLETSHAFHSPSMDAAAKEFAQLLADIPLHTPAWRFISCVTGEWITDEQAQSIDYWASQLRKPVRFSQGLKALADMPNLVVIEAGPGRTVSGMVLSDFFERSDLRVVPLLAQFGDQEVSGFSQALGLLWQYQLPLQWPELPITPAGFSRLPPYPFSLRCHEIIAAPAVAAPATHTPVISPCDLQHSSIDAGSTAAPYVANTTISPLESEQDLMKNALIPQLETLFSDISGMDLHGADQKSSFFELGLDSLLLTQSAIKLKKLYKVPVSFRQLLNELDHLDALASYLIEQKAEGLPSVAPVLSPAAAPAAVSNTLGNPTAIAAPSTPAPAAHGVVSLPALPLAVLPADGSMMSLVQQQLLVMQQQLQFLTGQIVPSAEPSAASAAASASPTSKPAGAVKPFGAGTRINVKRSNEMSEAQTGHLKALADSYNSQFKSSKTYAQTHRPYLADPRVVSGFRTSLKEIIYPIVVERSEGAYLWDIDGNRLVDITCGFGSNFFGNGAPFIKNAVAKQLDTGYEIGPQHPLTGQAAKLFCEITGNERVAFCNTGSEAVLGAMRLARTVTGKEKIVMFENDYHGIVDEVIVTRSASGFASPAAAGIPEAAVENVFMLDYGDDASLAYIVEHADEIAALLIEPIQSRYPELQPKAFLEKARAICTEHNIALIFDEVITGFRIHQQGAQGYFGIAADICTYGKIFGGGMPVGAISGKAVYMDALDGGAWQFGDDSIPQVGVTYFAGTFVRHPLALAATVAVLTKMQTEPHLQSWLNARADNMVGEINRYAQSVGAPIKIANCGSMCKIKVPQEIPYEELVYVLLRKKGIHVWDARPTFITTAHSDEDIAFIVNAFKEAIDEMLAMEFFPRVSAAATTSLAGATEPQVTETAPAEAYANEHFSPPTANAKLGRDEEGNACWFVPSTSNPAEFVKWQG
ncbi:MAG TPA: amino acid adenylation domain-containing protein [Cellvibrionaceae bacterium]